jgi:hypothetical protein
MEACSGFPDGDCHFGLCRYAKGYQQIKKPPADQAGPMVCRSWRGRPVAPVEEDPPSGRDTSEA